MGCSCLVMSQNYTSVPKVVLRNINYIILFKINDLISINHIIRNHNLTTIDKDLFKKVYQICTKEPLDCMILDFRITFYCWNFTI